MKTIWNRLLNVCPQGSVLMGGAVVDWWATGEAPNDYDIFHTYKPGEPFAILPPGWEKTEAHFNDPEWAEAHQELYLQSINAGGGNPIGSVYEYLVDGEHKVQMIGVHYDKPLKHFKNFDHSLTLGWYNPKSGVFLHRKVFEALADKVCEYVGKSKDFADVLRSYNRARKKAQKVADAYGHNLDQWEFKNFIAGQKVEINNGLAL